MLNEWNGDDDEENDDNVNVSFEKFFSVEDLCRVKGWQLKTGCVVEDNF